MTQEEVKEWFDYDAESGAFTWRKRPKGSKIKPGQVAGWLSKSKGKTYRYISRWGSVHRLIWLWVTGHMPVKPEEIDHKDGNGLNNRWRNLRLVAGRSEQCRNLRLRKNNTSGTTGVYFETRVGKYAAAITVNQKTIVLGRFSRIEDAVAAREAASKKYSFHPNHGQERPL